MRTTVNMTRAGLLGLSMIAAFLSAAPLNADMSIQGRCGYPGVFWKFIYPLKAGDVGRCGIYNGRTQAEFLSLRALDPSSCRDAEACSPRGR